MNATRGIAGVLLALLVGECSNGTGPNAAAPTGPSGRIVFQSTRPGGTPELLVMDPDGSNVQTLLSGPATYQSPAFSPDGARIAFSSNRDGDFDIYVMNRDGTGLAHVTGPSVPDTTYDDSPAWSPDGSKLVFTRSYSLGAQLMVAKVDGSSEVALTPVVTSGYLDWPSWSPDGTKIAFTGGGTPGIFVMNADGSGTTRVSSPADTTDHPAWSPDGTEIAAHSLSHGLIVMHPDGSNLMSLGQTGTESAWSPDGKYLVFTKYFPGNPRIARITTDGSGEMDLTAGTTALDGHPSWGR